MKHIKVLGITGGVGAGKSTVLAYLEKKHHARVLQLDEIAHLLMEPGQACYRKLVEAFGSDILGEDGAIFRPALYEKTFSKREEVERLNGIVHPMVKDYVKEQIKQERKRCSAPFLVLEAALLLDDHYEEICDEIWYIHVDSSVRLQRLHASRGYTEEKTRRILENQKSEEEFRRLCQFTVDNSSDILENTYGQIDRGLREHGFL